MRHLVKLVPLCLMSGVLTASAQERLQRPPLGTPTIITGPASLSATATPGQITLVFPPVVNAQAYRVTRTSTTLGPRTEQPIFEEPVVRFTSPDNDCSTTSSQPNCVYVDTRVNRRLTYTYRVWTIFAGPVVSPPSPTATVAAQ